MEKKTFHIGNFLRDTVKEQRFTITELTKLVNKTEPAIRSDFNKDSLHMSVLEAYAKALDFNVYDVLAKNWAGEKVEEPHEGLSYPQKPKKPDAKQQMEPISITFQVDPSKKEQLIALLTS